jgi:proteasome activator subunit 4
MKSSRFIKLKTTAHDPIDKIIEQNHNPLRRHVPIKNPTHEFTNKFMLGFRTEPDLDTIGNDPLLCEKVTSGWLVWAPTIDLFVIPNGTKSIFEPWDSSTLDNIDVYREIADDPSFWKKLSKHFSSENHAQVITQDHVSCVKSILQLLNDHPLKHLKPIIQDLLADKDKNKQRGAAELLAAIIGGSKH